MNARQRRARRRGGPPRIVTLEKSSGSWSGEPYWRAVCGCGFRASMRRIDRDKAERDARKHHFLTHHYLRLDVVKETTE